MSWRWLSMCLAASVAACVEHSDPAYRGVSAVIESAGGTLELDGGARLTVPPGALAYETTITITELRLDRLAALPIDRHAASAPYAFEPHGLSFAQDVTIDLPHVATSEVVALRLDDTHDTTWS